jgi:hypothetical protein
LGENGKGRYSHRRLCMKETFDILSIGIGAILMITTIVYACITGRMLNETKKMRKSQTEPNVFITIEPVEQARSLLNLVIQNIGQGAAIDLKFKVEPDILLVTKKNLSEVNFMRQGFSRLAPRQRFEFIIANVITLPKEEPTTVHKITVSYKDKNSKLFNTTFELDFTEYFGMPYVEKDPYEGIIKKLDSIHQDIERVSRSSGSKLWVVACTKQEYEEGVRKQLEEYEEIERQQREKK